MLANEPPPDMLPPIMEETSTLVDEGVSATVTETSTLEKTWVKAALLYLRCSIVKYDTFLDEWAEIESKKKPSQKGLFHAPEIIKKWRKTTDIFTESSTPAMTKAFTLSFPGEVRKWWRSLQPKWRDGPVDNRLLPLTTIDGSWYLLDRWGLGGWVLLLTAMKWWWISACKLDPPDQEQSKKEWNGILEEMELTFMYVTTNQVSRSCS